MSSILGAIGGIGGGSIGRASVDLVLNTAAYNAQLDEAEAKTTGATGGLSKALGDVRNAIGPVGIAMAGAAAISVAAIGKAIGVTQTWADQVRSLQRVTGQTAESASALAAAGNVLGISTDQLNIGFGLLEKNIVNASSNLTKYGIVTKDAQGNVLPFDQVLSNVSDTFLSLQPGPEQAAFAMNVFGRSGKALIPILQQGSAGLQQLEDQARSAGLVLSQQDVDAAKALTISTRQMSEAFKGAAVQIGRVFIPLITPIVQGFTKMVEGAIQLGRAIGQQLAPFLTQVGTAFRGFLQSLQPLMPALEEIGKLLGSAGLVVALVPLIILLKALVFVFEALTAAVNVVIDSINFFIAGINKVIDASNTLLHTHFANIDALQQVSSATDTASSSTIDYGGTLGVATAATKTMSQAQTNLRTAVQSAGQGILSLQTTVKDTFNVSKKEMQQGFAQMLAVAIRFKADMAQLANLKLGLDKHNEQQFLTFLSNEGPGAVDRFVNSSQAAQLKWVSQWQAAAAKVKAAQQSVNDTQVTIHVNTSAIDAAAQKLHGLQQALARGL